MRSSDLCDLAGVSGWCGAVAREMPSRVQPAGEGGEPSQQPAGEDGEPSLQPAHPRPWSRHLSLISSQQDR